jgi:bifunctional non-homologous end joining protein LigD
MGTIKVGRSTIVTARTDTILFPSEGITKGDLIKYYAHIAPVILPHIKNRPISMQRFPNGIEEESFYQKDAPDYFPSWIKRQPIAKHDGIVNYVVVNNAQTLVYLANQACIVIHTWLSKIDKPYYPDRIIFDLDPSYPNFDLVRKAARILHDFLEQLGIEPFIMTTGSRGVHVVIPIVRSYTFETTRTFAQNIGSFLVTRYPELFTIEIRKEKRGRRIFIDTLRNAFGQTGVAPYSVRAKPRASIATPLFWHEIDHASLRPDLYTIKNIQKRLETYGDPWESMYAKHFTLPKAEYILRRTIE